MTKFTRHSLFTGALAATFAMGFVTSEALADQPHMQAALNLLRSARGELQKATADKGGHRVKAIAAIDTAIAEVKAGIKFDRAY